MSSNIAARVRVHKQTWPELYCPNPRCLWRVKRDEQHDTPCPKHMTEQGSLRTQTEAQK